MIQTVAINISPESTKFGGLNTNQMFWIKHFLIGMVAKLMSFHLTKRTSTAVETFNGSDGRIMRIQTKNVPI